MKDETLQQQQSLEQYEQHLRQRAQQGDAVACFELVDHFERKGQASNMLEAQTRINLLIEASNKNVGAASVLLGHWYLTGHYVTSDTAKAILFFEHAGNVCKQAAGFYRLAEMFDRGVGVAAHVKKANEYLKKAVELKHPDAIFTTALQLLVNSVNKAFQLLKDNYQQQGHIRSLFLLNDEPRFNRDKVTAILKENSVKEPFAAALLAARLLQENQLEQIAPLLEFAKKHQNPIAYYVSALMALQHNQSEQAQQDLLMAASLGHVEAAYRAGLNLAEKIDAIANEKQHKLATEQMLKLFAQAAQDGFAPAQFSLAQCWLQGVGVEKNQQEAIGWLDRAAQQGHVEAMFVLALNLAVDHPQHLPLLQAAAQAGHSKAILCIGMYHQNNNEPTEAIIWFNKAKDLNDARADYFLGQAYLQGLGVEADSKQAMAHFKIASEEGDADAAFALYQGYRDGVGVRRNKKSQEKYLKQAQAAQHPEALKQAE